VTGKRAEHSRAEITAARGAATRLPLKPIALVRGNPSLRTAASALIDVNAPSAFAQERVHRSGMGKGTPVRREEMKRARISRVTSHKRQRAARAVALICGGTRDYLSFPLRRVVSASMRLSRAHLRRIVPRPLAGSVIVAFFHGASQRAYSLDTSKPLAALARVRARVSRGRSSPAAVTRR